MAKKNKQNKQGASQDVRKTAANSDKNVKEGPAKGKELDGLCDALTKAVVKEVEDTGKLASSEVTVTEKELPNKTDEKPDPKLSPSKAVKKEEKEEKESTKLVSSEATDAEKHQSEKVDQKSDPKLSPSKAGKKEEEESAKPFKVVDDVEKEAYAAESKQRAEQKGGGGSSKQQLPMMRMPPTKKDYKVPREWACYSKCGEVVPTTPFLPFKSPLSEERFMRHPELEEHTICSLIQDLSSRGIRLTTVIDLTLPFFYETEFLEAFDIRYEKIRIDNQEPRLWQVVKFLEICDDFANQQFKRKLEWDARQAERKARGEDEEYYMFEVIGVHCTRGVNRTGYMICRAMIERMNYTAEHAVALFNQARGHEMTEFMPELKLAEEKKRLYPNRNLTSRGRGRGGRGGGDRGGRGGGGGGDRGGRGGGDRGAPRGSGGQQY